MVPIYMCGLWLYSFQHLPVFDESNNNLFVGTERMVEGGPLLPSVNALKFLRRQNVILCDLKTAQDLWWPKRDAHIFVRQLAAQF